MHGIDFRMMSLEACVSLIPTNLGSVLQCASSVVCRLIPPWSMSNSWVEKEKTMMLSTSKYLLFCGF